MAESKGPTSSIPFCQIPIHCPFSVFYIIFILSFKELPFFLPKKLSTSLHLSIYPFPLVSLPIKPDILSKTIKFILFKISPVVLNVLSFSRVLKEKIRIIDKRFSFYFLWSNPRKFFESFFNLRIKFLSEFNKICDEINQYFWIFSWVFFFNLLGLFFLLFFKFVTDKENQVTFALLEIIVKSSIISGAFEFLYAFSMFFSVHKLSFIAIDIFIIFYLDLALAMEFSHLEKSLKFFSPWKDTTMTIKDDFYLSFVGCSFRF